MPDRAVVDDDVCPQRVGIAGSWHHWSIPWEDGKRRCLDCGRVQPEPQPRAVVAISEDRQWLCAPSGPSNAYYIVYRWNPEMCAYSHSGHVVANTGQDAHEVLNAYLRERTP